MEKCEICHAKIDPSTADNKVAWYENINGNYGSQQIISNNADDAFHISTADLDNDGDEDVIVSCGVANRIEVFENLGNSIFGAVQIISATATFVHSTLPADFDGDGDLDLVSTLWGSNKIVWFRNEHITYAEDGLHNSISPIINFMNYPNPFNPSTTISFNLTAKDAENAKIEIYNLKGQKVKTFSHLQINTSPNQQIVWNGTDDSDKPVTSGIYLYKLKVNGKILASRKMILMK